MTKIAAQQFQYELQTHQENCVNNIINIFAKLQQKEKFINVFKQHHSQNKYNFPVLEGKNIDIMMETGTGKTFTFIKTIFELNKNFGYQKFIMLIPTVPIREGTKTSLEDTKDYFKTFYTNQRDKEIEIFVYENGNVAAVKQFINSAKLSVFITTDKSFNTDKNILNRRLDYQIHKPELFVNNKKQPKSYLDCLKRLNPVVIMDEPHRFEGDAFKKHFEGFDNYCLRFGATFPKKKDSLLLSNVAYVLDSISSFRQNLVKKICVHTQGIAQNADTLLAIVDSKKVIINSPKNGIFSKREASKGGIFDGKSIKKINKESIILFDNSIVRIDYILSEEALRAMIKTTIAIHFQKEKDLFEKGIKALTLFFMPSDISLFRGENPIIKTIFEQEYTAERAEILKFLPKGDYWDYLQNDYDTDHQLQVHKGYFSGDKAKTNDEKIKAGVNEILKDKKKLLSFGSPTRFIFSIWALQEGWDNPNVFTICKLSNQGNENSKLQQIGRGLRIAVNQQLQRNTLKALDNNQEAFWSINNLDVVVSSQEQGFVEDIQNEILANSFLVADIFTEQELKKLLKEKNNFDDTTVRQLFKMLDNTRIIMYKHTVDGVDIYEKSPEFATLLAAQTLPDEHRKALESLFATDARYYIQKAEQTKPKKEVFIKNTHLSAFQALWHTIYKNAFFVLETLAAEQETQLVYNIKTDIERLNIEAILLQTTRAELHINNLGQENAITKKITNTVTYQSKVDYLQLVRDLSNNTKTPIAFIIKIFNALSSEFKNKMLANNPDQAQQEISKIISQQLVNTIKMQVKYDGIDATVLPNVWKTEAQKTYLPTGSTGKFQKNISANFSLKTKWIFEEVIEYDSEFELNIVEKDPDIADIQIFAKLPRLKIKTPLGEYNPDFCYALQNNEGKKLFLVVESKGYDASADIPADEKLKIEFAKKYFDALNDYYKQQNQNVNISFRERINSTQLASLINDSK